MNKQDKQGKKILFLNFNCVWNPHFETELELMEKLGSMGAEIFSLGCLGRDVICVASGERHTDFCKECRYTSNRGFNLAKVPKSKRFKLKKIKNIKLKNFYDFDELKKYEYDGINIGIGVYSTAVHIIQDLNFNLEQYRPLVKEILKSSIITYENAKEVIEKIKPDEVYIFNGRFAEYRSVVEYCKKIGQDYYLHERGGTIKKYVLIKNEYIHSLERIKKAIQTAWQESELSLEEKKQIGSNWFHERRNKIEQSWISFVKGQETGRLPSDFNPEKENIAFFNSSMYEYAGIDDWNNPMEEDDNVLVKNVLERYKNDPDKHFYLRVHPNLTGSRSSQMKEIEQLKENYPENLTVIAPEDKVDTYKLIESSNKIITFGSTAGCEATYWGKPSILAGNAAYEDLDCVYKVTDYDEFYRLIDDKNLPPKPKENTLIYTYYLTSLGTPFEIYEPEGVFSGKYKGVYLHHKPAGMLYEEKIINKISKLKLGRLLLKAFGIKFGNN